MAFLNNNVNYFDLRYGKCYIATGYFTSGNFQLVPTAESKYMYYGVTVNIGDDGKSSNNEPKGDGGNGGTVKIIHGYIDSSNYNGGQLSYRIGSNTFNSTQINITPAQTVLLTLSPGQGGKSPTAYAGAVNATNGPTLPPPFHTLSVSGGGAYGVSASTGNGAMGGIAGGAGNANGTYGGGGGGQFASTTPSAGRGGDGLIILFVFPYSGAKISYTIPSLSYKVNNINYLENFYDNTYAGISTNPSPFSAGTFYTTSIIQSYNGQRNPSSTISYLFQNPFTLSAFTGAAIIKFDRGIYVIQCNQGSSFTINFPVMRTRNYQIICCGAGGNGFYGSSITKRAGGGGAVVSNSFTDGFVSSISLNCATRDVSTAIYNSSSTTRTITCNRGVDGSNGTEGAAGTATTNSLLGTVTTYSNYSKTVIIPNPLPITVPHADTVYSFTDIGFGGSGVFAYPEGENFRFGGGRYGISGASIQNDGIGYGAGGGGGTAFLTDFATSGVAGTIFIIFDIIT